MPAIRERLRSLVKALLPAMLLVIAGCGEVKDTAAIQPADTTGVLAITCTTGPVADIVRNVCGEHARITTLIGEGVDPHLYSPTSTDIKQLLAADIIFYSGLHLEGKMGDALIKVSRRGPSVYAVTELLDPSYLLEAETSAGPQVDPHVWMDASAWMESAEGVAVAMSEFDSTRHRTWYENAHLFKDEIQELHNWITACIASIPEKKRALVTAHDAFQYFSRAYGIDVLAIQGISTESEAGLGDINTLVDVIVERGIEAIFVETSVSSRNITALLEGAASRGHVVRIGGTLFSDSMGAPGTYEGTFIGMLDHNTTVITEALGGTVHHFGYAGRLSRAGE